MSRILQLKLVGMVFCCVVALGQTPDSKNYSKDGVSFDYSNAWQLTDDSNGDAQQLTLMSGASAQQ